MHPNIRSLLLLTSALGSGNLDLLVICLVNARHAEQTYLDTFLGQQALSVLSNQSLCATHFAIIAAAIILVVTLPRRLGHLQWLGL